MCFRNELILGDKINILLSLELLTRVMRFYAYFGGFLKTKKPVIVYDYRLLVSFDVYQAEEEGFEPSVPLPVRQFSKLFLSATQASLRILKMSLSRLQI